MNKEIQDLFERLRTTPFPALGKVVGDFALYDSLLAGTVRSFLTESEIDPETVPAPDLETVTVLSDLKKKSTLDREEADFLKYAQLLNELREKLIQAIKGGKSGA